MARDPKQILDDLAAKWSPDFDAYASGQIGASQVRCVLCTHAPCDCPPFGSDEYFALIDRRHTSPNVQGSGGEPTAGPCEPDPQDSAPTRRCVT